MSQAFTRREPNWISAVRGLIQRLPFGRYYLMHRFARFEKALFEFLLDSPGDSRRTHGRGGCAAYQAFIGHAIICPIQRRSLF